eukprot:9270071-Ditylum_brightwellii.AAC.1
MDTDRVYKNIIHNMIHHATETKRENGVPDKDTSKFIGNANQKGKYPIIPYQHIQKISGLNKKQEFKRTPNIYQNQLLYVDPDDLINLYIQETFVTRPGKEYKKSDCILERTGEDIYRVESPNGKQHMYKYAEIIAMTNIVNDGGKERKTFEDINRYLKRKGELVYLSKSKDMRK